MCVIWSEHFLLSRFNIMRGRDDATYCEPYEYLTCKPQVCICVFDVLADFRLCMMNV